jgi:hypothetical protein
LQEGHDWLASAESSVYFASKLIICELMVNDSKGGGEAVGWSFFSVVVL